MKTLAICLEYQCVFVIAWYIMYKFKLSIRYRFIWNYTTLCVVWSPKPSTMWRWGKIWPNRHVTTATLATMSNTNILYDGVSISGWKMYSDFFGRAVHGLLLVAPAGDKTKTESSAVNKPVAHCSGRSQWKVKHCVHEEHAVQHRIH